MGYRSDVAYTIRFTSDHDTNNVQSFYTFLAEAKSNPAYALALEEADIDEKRQRINFHATSIKWYESYVNIASHNALVEMARLWCTEVLEGRLHCSIGVMFLRVGEDTSDIDIMNAGAYDYEWVYTSRQIIMDWE